MSGGLSQQGRTNALTYFGGGSPAAAPTYPLFVSLHATDPGDNTVIGGSEAAAGSYARSQINALGGSTSPARWATVTGTTTNSLANEQAIAFAASSAAWTNSPFTWYGVCTASTAGTLLASGSLTAPVAVAGAGVTITFAIGQLQQTAARTP